MSDINDWLRCFKWYSRFRRQTDQYGGSETETDWPSVISLLDGAPSPIKTNAELIAEDIESMLRRKTETLEAQNIVAKFKPVSDGTAPNLVAGYSTVSGSSRAGTYSFQSALFTSEEWIFPKMFPELQDSSNLSGTIEINRSIELDGADGFVIFPELFYSTAPRGPQGFGIVMVDKLQARSLLANSRLPRSEGRSDTSTTSSGVVQTAFLAHEWGHRASPLHEEQQSIRGRSAAVVDEIIADLSALLMLAGLDRATAYPIATEVLVNRIFADTRLSNAQSQVNYIAGISLAVMLEAVGILAVEQSQLKLDLAVANDRLPELIEKATKALSNTLASRSPEFALTYLRDAGWSIQDNFYRLRHSSQSNIMKLIDLRD